MKQYDLHPDIKEICSRMIELRHRIHSHPECGFQEHNTSKLVVEHLHEWGYEVHQGLGKTGVVGTLHNGEGKSIGLRADMDALPIQEMTGLPYTSQEKGKMHACGHDGHTATLLAAAYALAKKRPFKGTLHLFFQPSEEGLNGSGAKAMMDEGLFDRFPCDAIFALHNMPGIPTGKFGFMPGTFMSSQDQATIHIHGAGGHGAMPHTTIDPIVVGASLVMALQTIVSRNVSPLETAIITVGSLQAGEANNVIPDSAELRLSIRSLHPEVRDLLQERITTLAQRHTEGFGARATVEYQRNFPVLINETQHTEFARQVALDWLGEEGLITLDHPLTGSEDFAYWLEKYPGCYFIVGNGDGEGTCMVHNPGYDFNDQILPLAASYWVKLVEHYLPAT